MPENFYRQGGYTLLEMLTVITILAIVATAGVLSVEDTPADAQNAVNKTEMANIRQALLSFRQNLRAFPGPGSLDPTKHSVADAVYPIGTVVDPDTSSYEGDLTQLQTCPPGASISLGKVCESWDPNTRNGWHGPYYMSGKRDNKPFLDPWYTSGDGRQHNYRLYDPDFDGAAWHCKADYSDCVSDATSGYDEVVQGPLGCKTDGTACQSRHEPPSNNSWCNSAGTSCQRFTDATHLYQVKLWCQKDGSSCKPMLKADAANGYTVPYDGARLVSPGPDGQFAGHNDTFICQPKAGSDDVVLCLVQ